MSAPTQFRQYLISQDAGGNNVEVARSAEQVGVLAFDSRRMCFVHCHVLMEPLKNRRAFDERAALLASRGHPLIARLVECGEDDGNAFYITEHVDGETLSGYLARQAHVPLWLAMRLSLATARALIACLERGDFLPAVLPDVLRLVQNGPLRVDVVFSDFRLVDERRERAAKSRLVKSAVDKQVRFLLAFLEEQKQMAPQNPGAARVTAGDFAEVLYNLLASVSPDSLKELGTFCETLEPMIPAAAETELSSAWKPQPLLAAQLAGTPDVARSLAQVVRVQSQKLDAARPYAVSGTFLKSGQAVLAEQLPPRRIAGARPSETVQQTQAQQKAGKFPNLVPVILAQEKDGIESVVEAAVEGVALNDLLDARGTLQPQEVYLVLAGLDTALGQLEKSGVAARRIRLEDVHLFTGFGKDNARDSGLLSSKLNEWPGFSIALRTHPSLHGMACRGIDPSMLLPLNLKTPPGVEADWHGGWMAALGCFLIGFTSGKAVPSDRQVAGVVRMLDDEIDRARRGAASARSAFLARFARVLQQLDLANFQGGMWSELSGSTSAQGHAAEVARSAVTTPAPVLPPVEAIVIPKQSPPAPELVSLVEPMSEVRSDIGFAELLIRGASPLEEEALDTRRARRQALPSVESSWMSVHQGRPFWLNAIIVFFGSLALGALLATISGRALWQEPPPAAESGR